MRRAHLVLAALVLVCATAHAFDKFYTNVKQGNDKTVVGDDASSCYEVTYPSCGLWQDPNDARDFGNANHADNDDNDGSDDLFRCSYWLVCQNFDFSFSTDDKNRGALRGMKVEVKRDGSGSVRDDDLSLWYLPERGIGSRKRSGDIYPSSAAVKAYGGNTATWGMSFHELPTATVDSSQFGVVYAGRADSANWDIDIYGFKLSYTQRLYVVLTGLSASNPHELGGTVYISGLEMTSTFASGVNCVFDKTVNVQAVRHSNTDLRCTAPSNAGMSQPMFVTLTISYSGTATHPCPYLMYYEYPYLDGFSISALVNNVVGVDVGTDTGDITLSMTENSRYCPDSNCYLALVPEGSDCTIGSNHLKSWAYTSSSKNVGTFSSSDAGTYDLCLSVMGSAAAGFVKQLNPATKLHVVLSSAMLLTSASPTSFGTGTSINVAFASDVRAKMTLGSDTRIGLTLGSCSSVSNTVTLSSSTDKVTDFHTFSSFSTPGDYKVCVQINSDYVEQTITVAVRDGSMSSFSPSLWGGKSIPLLEPGLLSVVSTGTWIGFSTSTACSGIVGATEYFGVPVALASEIAPATDTMYYVCTSVDGGSSYDDTTYNVTVTAAANSLTAWAPARVVPGVTTTVLLMGVTPTPSTAASVSTSSSTCPGLPQPLRSNNKVTVLAGPSDSALYACVSTDDSLFIVQAPVLEVVSNTDSTLWDAMTPSHAASGHAFSWDLTGSAAIGALSADFPNAKVGLAFPGSCTHDRLFETAATSDTISVSATVTLPANVAPPTTDLVLCFAWDPAAGWIEQDLTIAVVVDSVSSITTVAPTVFFNNSQPVFEFPGTTVTVPSVTKVALAAPGLCESSPIADTISAVVAGPIPMHTGPVVVTSLSLDVCYSIDDGVTWNTQVFPRITVTNDILSLAVGSISPTVFGTTIDQTLTISNVLDTPSPNGQLALATDTTCTNRIVTFAFTTGGSATYQTGTGITESGQYVACYSESAPHYNDSTWRSQAASTATLSVLKAASDSITGLSESVLGAGASLTLELTAGPSTSALGCGTCLFGLTLDVDDCAPAQILSQSAIGVGTTSVSGVSLSSGGDYDVCYSTDNGANWVMQTSLTVTVIEAQTNSLQGVSPNLWGDNALPQVTFTGLQATSTTMLAFSSTLGSCGSVTSPLSFNTDNPTVIPDLNGGTGNNPNEYTVCYSTDSGSTYQPQDTHTITVLSANAGSVTAVSPSFMGSNALPSITLSWAQPSSQGSLMSAIAFVAPGDSCTVANERVGQTTIPANVSTVTLASPISVSAVTTYDLCFTVNLGQAGEQWYEQTMAGAASEMTVVPPSVTSVTQITPNVTAVNVAYSMQIAHISGLTTARIAFSTGASCNPATLLYETDISGAGPYALPGFTAIALHRVCYSVDGGASWWLQADAFVDVVTPQVDTVATISPTTMGAGTNPMFALTGSIKITPDARLAFTLAGEGCGAHVALIDLDSPVLSGLDFAGPSISPASTSVYEICLTYDNSVTWVKQSLVSVTVVVPSATSVTSLSPAVLSAGRPTTTLTVTGEVATPTSQIGFDPGFPSAPCSNDGQVEVPTLYDDVAGAELVLSGTPNTYGGALDPNFFYVCFRVNPASSWTLQSMPLVQMSVARPSSVVAVVPDYLTLSERSPLTLTLNQTLTPITSVLKLGLAINSTACNPAAVEGEVYATAGVLSGNLLTTPLSSNISTEGYYSVCVSTDDGSSWTEAQATIRGGSVVSSSLQQVSPVLVQTSAATTFTFEGIAYTQETIVAMVNASLADPCGNISTFSHIQEDSTATLTLSETGPHRVCASSDNGATWVLQTSSNAAVDSIDCSTELGCSGCRAQGCSWCMGQGTCQIESTCPNQICNTCTQPTCPTFAPLDSSSLLGPNSGGEMKTFTTDYALQLPGLSCQWEIFGVATYLTNATVVDPTTIQCAVAEAPIVSDPVTLSLVRPQELATVSDNAVAGYMPYGRAADAIDFDYYVCDDVPLCSGCWDATTRPSCGYCQQTQSCVALDVCEETTNGTVPLADLIWESAGTCPTITAIDPPRGPAYGGTTIRLTTSSLFSVPVMSWQCEFGAGGPRANGTIIDSTTLECRTPAIPAAEVTVRILSNNVPHTLGSGSGALFTFFGSSEFVAPPSPSKTPMIAGVVGGLLCLVLVALLVLGIVWKRQRDYEAMVRPPVLTDDMRLQIWFGTPPPVTPEDRRLLPHLQDFVNAIVMDYEVLAVLGDVTQATEVDRLTKAVNVIYESRALSLDVLLHMVTREVEMSLSEATLFRTNSFATKLFKTYSKMKGVDFLHAALGRIINVFLLEDDDDLDVSNLRNKEGNALDRFALLTKCQKLFMSIKEAEWRVPAEFRVLFAHVQQCMRERYPINMEDLGAYVSAELASGLTATADAYADGSSNFEQLTALTPHIDSDINAMESILGPITQQLGEFELTVRSLEKELKRMQQTVEKMKGALDPRSNQGQRILQDHQRKQNSIAIGGFFFLRFLVPALTAPEAYHLVHEPPLPNGRRLLVLLGKVLQNLSNNKEFGGKEQHMTQLNDFIVSNQNEINTLFEKLSDVNTHSNASFSFIDVPMRHLEAHTIAIYKHAVSIREKFVEHLQQTEVNGRQLSDVAIQQRNRTIDVFNTVMDNVAHAIEAGGRGNKFENWIATEGAGGNTLLTYTIDDNIDVYATTPGGKGGASSGSSGSSSSYDDDFDESGDIPLIDLL